MRLEKLAAISEIVSSVAIVLTLGYLAIQTNQNTIAIQSTAQQSIVSEDVELVLSQLEFPHIAPPMYDRHRYSEIELLQLSSWVLAFIRLRESQWMQFRNGVIDQATWETYRSPIAFVLAPEVTRSLWDTLVAMGTVDADFAREVNELIDGSSIQGSPLSAWIDAHTSNEE
jgi:hypothetical protein